MSVNRCTFIGRLTADPQLNTTPAGQPVCNFYLAVNETWKDKSGDKKERAEFIRVVSFGKLAEICSKYLERGKQVYVDGRMHSYEKKDRSGNQRFYTEIQAQDVRFLDSRPEDHGGYDEHQSYE